MSETHGARFRKRVTNGKILPLVGVYDVFSARLAAELYEGIFCSGFSFAASAYGLPDIGFLTWRDITDFALRIRSVIPDKHLLVDVDDGFGDQIISSTVIKNLEQIGVSAVMFEDQKRPRRCGHYDGKEILPIDEYVLKLEAVLEGRKDLFVIARTDATDPADAFKRARRYAEAGADGVMVEAIRDLSVIRELAMTVPCPIMVNQLHGGKSPNWTLDEMEHAGVSIVIYSTPCLFSAQHAIQNYLKELAREKKLPCEQTVKISECNAVLFGNSEVEVPMPRRLEPVALAARTK